MVLIKYRNVYHNMIENHFKRLFPFQFEIEKLYQGMKN